MNNECQFWWNWWVNAAVAVGTFLAILAALFGDKLKNIWFKPKLILTLRSKIGERTPMHLEWVDHKGLQTKETQARYYHLQVSNQNRWPIATDVQLILIRLEEPGPNGVLQGTWVGDVPIRLRHQEIYPMARNIGPTADYDLCSVRQDGVFGLHPLIMTPLNLVHIKNKAATMVVSLQARSNEADSKIYRFRIAWDGKWEDGDSEMLRHFIVEDITDKTGN
jgi:hypothetical protein